MNLKTVLPLFLLLTASTLVNAQKNKILISYDNGKTESITAGESIRLTYPTAKLQFKKSPNMPEFLGLRGKVDSIGLKTIYLKVDKRESKNVALDVDQILAIKKSNSSKTLITFIASYAIIGTSAVLLISQLNTNGAITAFAGAFSLFPAGLVTANIFYPAKPRKNVGDGYQIKVITIN